ncbi:MAG: aspartate ammonia-lyase [Oscillospiraceae bacterium]|nr:aspartate ammonia-lyase [Oscillospiraceae bacterium]
MSCCCNYPTRTESDSVGSKAIPADVYYGVQSLRAKENFSITGNRLCLEMVKSLALLKKACAIANREAGVFDAKIANAIIAACDDIYAGKFYDQFIVDPIQGGAGTSMNMNINEVVANVAIEKLGGTLGDYSVVHPNDHVNQGQSTNDVVPTAGKMTVIALLQPLMANLKKLEQALTQKAVEFDSVIKMGRTQLQDAVPVRLGQEFAAYAAAVRRSLKRIDAVQAEMYPVNMGGTAIGTGINADINYYNSIVSVLAELTGTPYCRAEDMIDATQHIDCFAAVSGALKECALALSKISNDLRLMSSGPRTGIGEINLPARQNGSSIMPGKINPVIPEVVSQVAFRVVGNDMTIAMAVEAGQFELNAFEPVVFDALFQSITTLTGAVDTLTVNCVEGITANEQHCLDLLNASVGTITAVCPYIGYAQAASLAKEALKTGVPVRTLLVERGILTAEEVEQILNAHNMTQPGVPGKN